MPAAKARTYLRGGTRPVWVVWSHSAHIDVWRLDNLVAPVATLHLSDALNGEGVVPGFTHPAAAVFAAPLA